VKCCGRVLTEDQLTLLDGDPELVPDDVVQGFADHSESCFDEDEYKAAWRRLAYRVVRLLENAPDTSLTGGLWSAKPLSWPEDERAALRAQVTDAMLRVAEDEERWPALDALFQFGPHLDESLTPWLRLVDTFPDEVVTYLADKWAYAVNTTGEGDYGYVFIWEEPTAGEEMREWLFRPALRDRLSGVDSEAAQEALLQIDWLAEELSTR